jgi:hypothetical protein
MAAAQDAGNAHLRQSDSRISTHAAKAALYPLKQIRIVIAAKEPPQARAPHAGWMTVQVGLLTRGSMPLSAFPGQKAQWHDGKRLSAYSCGRSCGFGSLICKKPHRIPMLPIFRSAHLNAAIMAATFEMSMRRED